ncbi:hypothetical protein F9C07_2104621 [Aspergillus flavus]|uniref:Uncharacterized protein n=1 Tax=Aspergillus flavus (strain ATCC 200026 / FGSC A1120 / IAM 13836 / NRRL 3357 / JCM 12722 / SRRC 167) TaxID=332952 RepID=A0A7U2ML82_ASPFN|nr:hypothetical protein F9C07_2104621 [Aspergillus flavus]
MCSLSQLFLCALLLTPNAIANNDKASFSDVIVKDGSTEYGIPEIGHRVSSQMATSRLMNRNTLLVVYVSVLKAKGRTGTRLFCKGIQNCTKGGDEQGYKPGFQYVDFPIPKDIPTVAVSSSSWTVQMSNLAMSIMLVIFGEIREWKGAFHAHQFLNGSGKVINESVSGRTCPNMVVPVLPIKQS